jgi:hypothetical protein
VSASSLHKCSSYASRSYQGIEISVSTYNFVEGFNFVFNVIEGPGDVFGRRGKLFRSSSNWVKYPLKLVYTLGAMSTHLFRRSLIDSCNLVFFSASTLTLILRSFVSWSKRRELSSKVIRASLSSLLNLEFWDRNSASEPSTVCSRMSFSFKKDSSSFILSSKTLIMTLFFLSSVSYCIFNALLSSMLYKNKTKLERSTNHKGNKNLDKDITLKLE